MSRRYSRAGLIFFACVFISHALCQSSPAPGELDSNVYRLFFQEVLGHEAKATGTKPVLLNGQASESISTSVGDAIGITDQEVHSLVEAGNGCETEILSLEGAARALVFESRLRAANEEQPTDDLAKQLKELDAKRIQIILDHVERMKNSLGAERFKLVDDYIRAHANAGSFFSTAVPKKL